MNVLKGKMDKAIDHIKHQLTGVRTGRAAPSLLNKIQVDYYGSMVPINQVASISVPEPAMLLLNVFDAKAVQNIEKAISSSDLGLNPQTEGNMIRLRLPELTEERRKDLVKVVKTSAEEARVAIRNIRRDAMDSIKRQKNDNDITEDELKRDQDQIQKLTDSYIDIIEKISKEKESEIMTI